MNKPTDEQLQIIGNIALDRTREAAEIANGNVDYILGAMWAMYKDGFNAALSIISNDASEYLRAEMIRRHKEQGV